MQEKKIVCVIGSLDGGGAERVMTNLTQHLAELGHHVDLLTVFTDIQDCYPVSNLVRRHRPPDEMKSVCRWFDIPGQIKRQRYLRKALLDLGPDVVISFIDTMNVSVLLALRGTGIPVIASEHIDPRHHRIGWHWDFLRRVTYPWASAVTVLTKTVRDWGEKSWPRARICTIPNAITTPRITPEYSPPTYFGKRNIVAMGRLAHQKGFDLLLRAFSMCSDRFPDWHLTILGEGDQRASLESILSKENLTNRVHLPGRFDEPAEILQHADLFVMSSRYEGFGMALAEAMALGLPVVSFDCPSGPSDIIRHGIDGLLVPPEDTEALSKVLQGLMSDEAARMRLAERAPEVLERFSPDRIMGQWQTLIESVTSQC